MDIHFGSNEILNVSINIFLSTFVPELTHRKAKSETVINLFASLWKTGSN